MCDTFGKSVWVDEVLNGSAQIYDDSPLNITDNLIIRVNNDKRTNDHQTETGI